MNNKQSTSLGALFLIILTTILSFQTIQKDRQQITDQPTKNKFQATLKLDSIYLKNKDATLQQIKQQPTLKILNWNIERGYNLPTILQYLKKQNADILCLQEIDWNNKRTSSKDIGLEIAKELNMAGYYGIEYFELESPLRDAKLQGGGVHGNMILSKIKPDNVYRVELPQFHDWYNHPEGTSKRYIKEKRIGGRFAICADFQNKQQPLTICSVHFENVNSGVSGRLTSLDALLEAIPTNNSLVLAGDLNTFDNKLARIIGYSHKSQRLEQCGNATECDCWKTQIIPKRNLNDPFTCDQWTYKVSAFKAKLDWILTKKCTIKKSGQDDFNTSDHKPQWIEIIING